MRAGTDRPEPTACMKNVMRAAAAAKQKLTIALETKSPIQAVGESVTAASVSESAGADAGQKDDLLPRLLELSEVASVESVVRAARVPEGELQELTGRMFVLLFRDSLSEEPESQTGSRIRSARALSALLQLLPTLPPELGGFYLSSLHSLLANSTASEEVACAAGAIGQLLRWLPRLLPSKGDMSSSSSVELADLEAAVRVRPNKSHSLNPRAVHVSHSTARAS